MVTKERCASRNDINNVDRGRASQAKGTTAQSPKWGSTQYVANPGFRLKICESEDAYTDV